MSAVTTAAKGTEQPTTATAASLPLQHQAILSAFESYPSDKGRMLPELIAIIAAYADSTFDKMGELLFANERFVWCASFFGRPSDADTASKKLPRPRPTVASFLQNPKVAVDLTGPIEQVKAEANKKATDLALRRRSLGVNLPSDRPFLATSSKAVDPRKKPSTSTAPAQQSGTDLQTQTSLIFSATALPSSEVWTQCWLLPKPLGIIINPPFAIQTDQRLVVLFSEATALFEVLLLIPTRPDSENYSRDLNAARVTTRVTEFLRVAGSEFPIHYDK